MTSGSLSTNESMHSIAAARGAIDMSDSHLAMSFDSHPAVREILGLNDI